MTTIEHVVNDGYKVEIQLSEGRLALVFEPGYELMGGELETSDNGGSILRIGASEKLCTKCPACREWNTAVKRMFGLDSCQWQVRCMNDSCHFSGPIGNTKEEASRLFERATFTR
jgi:hypothetical protein